MITNQVDNVFPIQALYRSTAIRTVWLSLRRQATHHKTLWSSSAPCEPTFQSAQSKRAFNRGGSHCAFRSNRKPASGNQGGSPFTAPASRSL